MNTTISRPKKAEYVLQAHVISRSIYRMTPTARKIIAMTMAMLPPDLSILSVSFSEKEFRDELGIPKGGKTQKLIETAVMELYKECYISMYIDDDWISYPWIAGARISKGKITIEISEKIKEEIQKIKRMYARIDIEQLGKIHSFYALRYYEIAKSYESLGGKNGNKKGEWYYSLKTEELRKMVGLEYDEYRLTAEFKRNVIEKPTKELNKADVDIIINPIYIREGRQLSSVRFECRSTRPAKRTRKAATGAAGAGASKPIAEGAAERRMLQERYPVEYATWLAHYSSPAGEAELPPLPEAHGLVSIHAPAWGATAMRITVATAEYVFQSTHPRGVRPPGSIHTVSLIFRFQSTHPRGVRRWGAAGQPPPTMFQSTHPRGVRQNVCKDRHRATRVSIHAPAWGATTKNYRIMRTICVFQSTHPRGVRLLPMDRGCEDISFNPRTRVGCDAYL